MGLDRSSAEGRWIFRFFSRHFCIDHRRNCFPIGRHSTFIASLLRINCLSYFYHPPNFPRPARIYQFGKPRFSVCGDKNTISSRLALPPTTINYRAPGIIRRKPPRVLIKPVIHPLDFRQLKTGVPNWYGRGPNLFDIKLEFVWILDEGFNLPNPRARSCSSRCLSTQVACFTSATLLAMLILFAGRFNPQMKMFTMPGERFNIVIKNKSRINAI